VLPSDQLELLPSESLESDLGEANILTYFEDFGMDGGGATLGGSGCCCGSCWDGGTYTISGGVMGDANSSTAGCLTESILSPE